MPQKNSADGTEADNHLILTDITSLSGRPKVMLGVPWKQVKTAFTGGKRTGDASVKRPPLLA